MTAKIIPFRPRQKKPVRVIVTVYTLMCLSSGERVEAVDEHGAAAKLGLSLDEFRRRQPVPQVSGIDGPFYAVDDVAAFARSGWRA